MKTVSRWIVSLGRVLWPLVVLVFAWTLLFELFRIILIAASWSLRGDATVELLARSLWHGLQFDLSMAAKLVAAFALWKIWRPSPRPTERRVARIVFGLMAFVCVFALIAEVEFYKEFQMRLGPLAFEYFGKPDQNQIVLGMIWHGYPVVRWMLVCVALWAAFVWLADRAFLRQTMAFNWRVAVAATVVWTTVTIIAARGGVASTPLRWGDAFFSQSSYVNQVTQNGLFALGDTFKGFTKKGRNSVTKWVKSIPPAEAVAVTRATTLLPGETLVEPSVYALLRRSPPTQLDLLKRPKNVVVVIMESFTARFCGAVGADFGATPCFDKLSREGILFDRAFSAGTHTAQGVFATLCSFPSPPRYDALMRSGPGAQPFRSLPAILSENGFQSSFLYNGLFSWDNEEGFFRNHGVQQFVGRADYVNPVFVDPDWGVSDLDVFRRANEEFDRHAKTGEPFLGIIQTMSNHAPFNLPPVEGLLRITLGGDQNKRINGVHYADWAIGQFMDEARKKPWFADTLFVFTGDHGFGVPPVLTEVNILRMHVPILFYGPGVFGGRHEVRHMVVGQLDILPTILGLLGTDVVHQSFGRNLFALAPGDPGHAFVRQSGDSAVGLVEGDYVAVASPDRATTLHRVDFSFPPSESLDLAAAEPERTREMERKLRGLVATSLTTLESNHAAPRR